MRKTTIAATLSIILLGAAGTAFAAHTDNPTAEGMAKLAGMGMMPMMMGMMPMAGMPMDGQPMAGMPMDGAAHGGDGRHCGRTPRGSDRSRSEAGSSDQQHRQPHRTDRKAGSSSGQLA